MIRSKLALLLLVLATGCPHDLSRDSSDGSPAGDGAGDHDGSGLDSMILDLPVHDSGPDLHYMDLIAQDSNGACKGMTCPLGCNGVDKRCNRLKPTNFPVSSFFKTISAKVITSTAKLTTFNTDTGAITQGSTLVRPANKKGLHSGVYWQPLTQKSGYPNISIFGLFSLEVVKGSVFVLKGSLAGAIYAKGGIDISGTINLPVSAGTAGPGGMNGGSHGGDGASCFGGGGKAGINSSTTSLASGGGGGGRMGNGGRGGDAGGLAGGKGGILNGADALSPLFGGCGGGGGAGRIGASPSGQGGTGGGGGGALQLSSNGNIKVSGSINVPGAGGGGSHYHGGGGGGGSGGSVLLEGSSVSVTGMISANGGGGGGSAAGFAAQDGQDGQPGISKAVGSMGSGGGSGGEGGALTTAHGSTGSNANYYGGGGGGAAGRIRINSPSISVGGSKNISPAPSKDSKPGGW